MSSKNIAVRKDVYDALRRERRPGESFTQALVRLLSQRGPLDDLLGAWPRRAAAADTRAWKALRFPSRSRPR